MVIRRLDERLYEVETSHGTLRRNRVQLRKTGEVAPDIEQNLMVDPFTGLYAKVITLRYILIVTVYLNGHVMFNYILYLLVLIFNGYERFQNTLSIYLILLGVI